MRDIKKGVRTIPAVLPGQQSGVYTVLLFHCLFCQRMMKRLIIKAQAFLPGMCNIIIKAFISVFSHKCNPENIIIQINQVLHLAAQGVH